MIGIVVALVIAIWFFVSANNVDKNGWLWAVIGLVSYYVPVFLWGLVLQVVLPGLDIRIETKGGAIAFGLAVGLSAVLVGVICAMLVRSRILLADAEPPAGPAPEQRESTGTEADGNLQ